MEKEERIIERIKKLREMMKKSKIDAYIIPTNDFHSSEYVGSYFKYREAFSGFTGSAGTLVVLNDEAGLWTDGRYFLQAEEELKNTTIDLHKMGEFGVLDIPLYLLEKLKEGSRIGFDGRTLPLGYVENLKKQLQELNCEYIYDVDFIAPIWDDRPSISKEPAMDLSVQYVGEARDKKIARVRAEMNKLGADAHLITSLDDIAWLLNIRGSDVKCNPVVLSYLLILQDKIKLYVNEGVISEELEKKLNESSVYIAPYNDIYEDIRKIDEEKSILLDTSKVNYSLYALIKTKKIIKKMNPTTVFKAIKNETEIRNSYFAHLKDGVALTKFIYWIKKNIKDLPLTELSACKYLEDLRKQNENYKGLSFDTIAGYDYHGAIIHYDPTVATDIPLAAKSFILVDSGAQYLEGTTDVTRTIALGPLSDEQIKNYTLVLKGHLDLGHACFKEGTNGYALDILARAPLAKEGLNFNHGTGHGVGFYLNVHEGPQSIAPSPLRGAYPFKEGMITSNEPGLYFANKYGIRIENLTVCKKAYENEYGNFLCFDDLTLAPYEVDAIDKSMLSNEQIKWIHTYHERVYKELSCFLTEDEKAWLKGIVEAI